MKNLCESVRNGTIIALCIAITLLLCWGSVTLVTVYVLELTGNTEFIPEIRSVNDNIIQMLFWSLPAVWMAVIGIIHNVRSKSRL